MTFTSHHMECYYPHMPHNYHATLEELLQTRDVASIADKTGLSPNGIFKYFDKELGKGSSNQKYGRYMKPHRSSEKRIRRPLNCFMVFSHLERKRVADEHPELHNADLSKILGRRWKGLTASERQPYIVEAERIRQLHTEMYPDYKYQPRRKLQGKKLTKKSEDDVETKPAADDEKLPSAEKKVSSNITPNTLSDIQHKSDVDTYRKTELVEDEEEDDSLPSRQQINIAKHDFCAGNFPDYGNHCYGNKQNNNFLFNSQYTTYQNIETIYHQTSPNLSPLSENGQIGHNGQCFKDFQNLSQPPTLNSGIDTPTITPIVFPSYCKENESQAASYSSRVNVLSERMNCEVKSSVNMNYAASCNHSNQVFYNQCGQSFLHSRTLDDDGYMHDGYLKTMPLVKNKMTASFTNIVESLQNIH